jgi:hypothetical protein
MTPGMGGPHTFQIVLTSNDAEQSTLELLVSADFPLP